ncbi:NACHT domain-containing protein [Sphingomonas faeni]|uniref:NACHT domain-containing protein n=1 Tax=Sphingomonas faeni TaxID=185950 RepID=UPI00277FB423|nr:hypothetical protein [Sphingomonas faeni]MDQ0840300.1 hypothetical protein [Sphingomonas faeni]
MSKPLLRRQLWYVDLRSRQIVGQEFLKTENRSLVVLGEAGMGKSTLLSQLQDVDGYALCSARKLIIMPDPKLLIGDATTLVIDALDEVSAQREGDAVDLVLRRLAELGLPRFILSCRVTDWRSATALQGIADIYDHAPLELHLDPLDRDNAIEYLAHSIGNEVAEKAIVHLEARGLSGLWRNPQTLELVAKVAAQGWLPDSKGQLFADAIKLLRIEHRNEKSATPLATLPEKDVLEAAGAGFATLIFAGKEALSRETPPANFDAPLAEASALPAAARLSDVLDSRLFEARAPDRFTYAHRAIGEFLGARWLAEQADTPRKQRRVLELLNNHSLVPANLRGIHAWLAWHSPTLADRIITSDPMGVIEYGDADTLTAPQGRALLLALFELSKENPRFRDWSDYRAGGLVQPGMLAEIRDVVRDANVEFGLRLLVLQALKGSDLAPLLNNELLTLLLDGDSIFALRSEAGDRLVEIQGAIDWPLIVRKLINEAGENSVRLASELMSELGYAQFDNALVLDMIRANFVRVDSTVGVFFGLERKFPIDRLAPLLDGVVAFADSLGDRNERRSNDAITDLAFALLARRLEGPSPDAKQLWSWLRPFDASLGSQRETRQAISKAFAANDDLRHSVQRHVLLDLKDDKNLWQRSWRMLVPASGLRPDEDDLLWLLDQIELGDPRWRELVELSGHGPEQGTKVRAAAERFAAGDDEANAWLAELAVPQTPDWQIEQEQREREQTAERIANWERHRAEFGAHIDAMRAGDYGNIVNPAKAYLKLFFDMGDAAKDGPARIEEWLGPELKDAALAGFEAFLTQQPPTPSATEIAISHAEGRRWEAAYIIVAALAERMRTVRGFDDLTDERLMAGYIELSQSRIDDHAGIGDLDKQLSRELRFRDQWESTLRLFFEPQFAASLKHVSGLYGFLRSEEDAALADRLGAEWLARFPQMSENAEIELIDHLLTNHAGSEAILALLPQHLAEPLSDQRRLTWDAVGIILAFDTTRARLDLAGPVGKELFWNLRARLGHRSRTPSITSLGVDQLAWAIETFRPIFPYAHRPTGGTTGDTNNWDATEYLVVLINRLGSETGPNATAALLALRDAPKDGYTEHLRIALAEQKRKRVEADWVAPDIATFASAVTDRAPTTAPQLQAVILEELKQVQAKVTGDPRDWYKDFFLENGTPKGEEDCRDTILKMFGDLPFGIQAAPEGHLADDKRCDIECTLPGIMVPIEIKGQWHKDLWTAADRQLDLLYTNDWRAERGIYLVLWFGLTTGKKPKKSPFDIGTPETAGQLRNALAIQSVTTREGRTEIVVLDLTRPT